VNQHELRQIVQELALKLGRTPTREELEKHLRRGSLRRAGGYAIVLKAAGLDPSKQDEEEKPREPKILFWDLETTNLVADYGWILCASYMWMDDKKASIIRLRDTPEFQIDRTDDSGLLKQFVPIFEQADIHVFWFGEYFDFPFFQTRLLIAGLPPLPNIPFIDGWKIARNKLKLRSNRLDAVSKILLMAKGEKREEKLQPTPRDWRRSMAGHEDALKVIEDRCMSDVRVLRQIYQKIRHLGSALPNLSKLTGARGEGCPACGSRETQSRGYRLTARGRHQRIQCQKCSHWFALPIPKKKA
jgi:uncharacterized protein YprB with RNaseH-like and TPR domain